MDGASPRGKVHGTIIVVPHRCESGRSIAEPGRGSRPLLEWLAVLPDLFGSEAVQRRRRKIQKSQVSIDLTAMVDLVLDHGAEPFPHYQSGARRCFTVLQEPLVGQRPNDHDRFRMEAIEQLQHGTRPVCQLRTVSRIPAWAAAHVLGEHVPFQGGKVPDQICESELVFPVAPVELIVWDRRDHA